MEGMGEREGDMYASKDHGQESNPGPCVQDQALMVRALLGEPPGPPRDRHLVCYFFPTVTLCICMYVSSSYQPGNAHKLHYLDRRYFCG